MNKNRGRFLIFAALLAMFSAQAQAVTILVDEWLSGNSGEAAERLRAQQALDTYNFTHDPDLPTPLSSMVTWEKNDNPEDLNSHTVTYTAPTGAYDFFFILTKYGSANGAWKKLNGDPFDTALHYVSAGDTLTYNPGGSGPPNGLSHEILWAGNLTRNVPDGGATAALLGLGVLGMAVVGRKS